MVFSHKSHGQKSDKESQSPMLKIFRDMAKNKDKEKDSEKRNLLKNKADKKRKKSSRSKSKDTSEEQFVKRSERHAALVSNHELRNGEFELSTNQSTKSEKSVRSDRHAVPLVSSHELKNTEFEICTTHSNMYAGEKNDSWWFKGEQDNPDPPAPDESYSCISCALKKIMSTDYACVACLITLFTISVIVAFLLVYNSIPGATNKKDPEVHSLHTKNKIGGQKQLWWDHVGRRGSGQWVEDEMSSYAVPQSMDSEGPDFQDLSSLVDSDSELSKILDSDIINGIQNNDRLKGDSGYPLHATLMTSITNTEPSTPEC